MNTKYLIVASYQTYHELYVPVLQNLVFAHSKYVLVCYLDLFDIWNYWGDCRTVK